MKAISLWQPWATLIAMGAKKIETRSWPTSYRGWIAIHAAKRKVKSELIELARDENYIAALGLKPSETYPVFNELPLGALVAVARLVDCKPVEQLQPSMALGGEYWLGNYSAGRFGWMLEDVIALESIPYKGEQGLFTVPNELLSQTLSGQKMEVRR